MPSTETKSITPTSQDEWRKWLEENHAKEQSIWVIFHKKGSGVPSVSWSQSVDEALCFGWIDSVKKTVDKERYKQWFSRRKPNGTWSRVNKDKVKMLVAEGRMTQAGLDAIAIAKQNGSWNILDSVEALIVPDDLAAAFDSNPGTNDHYQSLSKSTKKIMLAWLVFAKREETRQKRIAEIVVCAREGSVPKPFR